jgi:hypothetical protein
MVGRIWALDAAGKLTTVSGNLCKCPMILNPHEGCRMAASCSFTAFCFSDRWIACPTLDLAMWTAAITLYMIKLALHPQATARSDQTVRAICYTWYGGSTDHVIVAERNSLSPLGNRNGPWPTPRPYFSKRFVRQSRTGNITGLLAIRIATYSAIQVSGAHRPHCSTFGRFPEQFEGKERIRTG